MDTAAIAEQRQRRYNASVTYLHKIHSDLMVLRVRPDFGRPSHKPGQYTTLGLGLWEPRFPGCQDETLTEAELPKLVRRAYSISCSVIDEAGIPLDLDQTDYIEFYIVLVRDSGNPAKPPGLTPRLFMLREGDRIQIGEKITGHFTLDGVKSDDTVVFLSTGTGEAPHNYMLWQLLKQGHTGKIASACCVRYRRDLGYTPTHVKLMERYPNYQYLSLVTREAEQSQQKVYIQDLITSGQLEERMGAPLDPTRTHVYLCGNPKMIGVPEKNPINGERQYPAIQGVIEILETKYGFQVDNPTVKLRGNIHFEEYW